MSLLPDIGSALPKKMNFLIDPNTLLAIAEFPEVVTPEDIESIHEWGKSDLLPLMKARDLRGIVMDYSRTRKFGIGTLGAAVNANSEINSIAREQNIDFKGTPVVHVVLVTIQETAIRLLLLGSGFNSKSRRKVVRTHGEALNFINESNEKHGRQFNISDQLTNDWPL